jgi:hypothetical protein
VYALLDLIWWAKVGAGCGGVIMLGTLVNLTWKKVVRPVWRALMRLGDIADLIAGDKAKKIPSLSDRLTVLAEGQATANDRLEEHLREFHVPRQQQNGSRRPAPTPIPRRAR